MANGYFGFYGEILTVSMKLVAPIIKFHLAPKLEFCGLNNLEVVCLILNGMFLLK